MAQLPNPTDIKRLSGIAPGDHQPDDPKRFELFDRLRRFYTQFDAVRVTTGLGAIVDWTLRNGEEALNQRLLLKYGENLLTLEEMEAKQEEEELASYGGSRGSPRVGGSNKGGGSLSEGRPSTKPTMRQRIRDFYQKHDPSKLKAVEGIDKYVEYVQHKGVAALNEKLMRKYGACLEVDESELGKTENFKSFTNFYTSFIGDEEEEIVSKRSESGSSHTRKAKSNAPTETVSTVQSQRKLFKLPPDFEQLLNLFYAVYDPYKLTNGQVKVVARWTQRNGIEKLNDKLQAKYQENYDDFAQRVGDMRDELIDFYTKVDKMKLVKGLDEVLKWCLKNGREPLNRKLRAKYGRDLDSEGPANSFYDEEPAF